jgi:hypothetical protein
MACLVSILSDAHLMQAATKIWILAASLILHILVVINETAASRRKHDMFGVFFSLSHIKTPLKSESKRAIRRSAVPHSRAVHTLESWRPWLLPVWTLHFCSVSSPTSIVPQPFAVQRSPFKTQSQRTNLRLCLTRLNIAALVSLRVRALSLQPSASRTPSSSPARGTGSGL